MRLPAAIEETPHPIQPVSSSEAGYARAMDAYLHGDFKTAYELHEGD